jgi:hypothetical protein
MVYVVRGDIVRPCASAVTALVERNGAVSRIT